jgi:hypothetical protein
LLGGLRKPPNASRVSKRRMARFILNAETREHVLLIRNSAAV